MTATTDCRRCGAAAELFLCKTCTDELHTILTMLPRWLAHLEEAATGQTKMGENAPRASSDEAPIRFNGKASRLLDQAHGILVSWVRELCETRGVRYKPRSWMATAKGSPFIDVKLDDNTVMLFWLADNVGAIAGDEDAVRCYTEMVYLRDSIERVINRPTAPRFVGPCPALLEDRTRCGTQLLADRAAENVTCPVCKNTYNVEDAITRLLLEVRNFSFSITDLHLMLTKLEMPVPRKTLYDWVYKGRITPTGQHAGKSVYLLADVLATRGELCKAGGKR